MDICDQLLNKMEKQDTMDYELFDLDGKNYCPVDGTISLKKFVDDDNDLNFYSFSTSITITSLRVLRLKKIRRLWSSLPNFPDK